MRVKNGSEIHWLSYAKKKNNAGRSNFSPRSHIQTLYRIGAKSEDGSRRKERRKEVEREGTQTAEHTHAPLSNPAGDGKRL